MFLIRKGRPVLVTKRFLLLVSGRYFKYFSRLAAADLLRGIVRASWLS